jgi:hypothetical protein
MMRPAISVKMLLTILNMTTFDVVDFQSKAIELLSERLSSVGVIAFSIVLVPLVGVFDLLFSVRKIVPSATILCFLFITRLAD